MANTRFRHQNHEWAAQLTGAGHSGGASIFLPVDRWGVRFDCLSDEAQGPRFGHILARTLDAATEEELIQALDKSTT